MQVPGAGDEFDLDWLNTCLMVGGNWPHGRVAAVRRERIGVEFGLSGRTYRLFTTTAAGDPRSLVAKIEPVDKIRRAVFFRNGNEQRLVGSIPASYGADPDVFGDWGIILLEDISPATQGDDLVGCSLEEAHAVIEIVAHLHGTTWLGPDADLPVVLDGWATPNWEPKRWSSRLAKAHERYPDQYTKEVVERLAHFPNEVSAALRELAGGQASWVHHDPHLDNVLWRPDSSPVLLDWSGAVIAPPALDVAILLVSLAFRDDPPIEPGQLVVAYTSSLHQHGVEADLEATIRAASYALRPLIRGLIGWAGLVDSQQPAGRKLALRDDSVGRVLTAIRWLDA